MKIYFLSFDDWTHIIDLILLLWSCSFYTIQRIRIDSSLKSERRCPIFLPNNIDKDIRLFRETIKPVLINNCFVT